MNFIGDVFKRLFDFWPNMASKKRKLNDGTEDFNCDYCDERSTENEALSQRIRQLEQMYEHEKREKDNALARLSSDMSSRLRDNNPNIADLSDPNRPTKLAEQFSELYDNEWTDAYDVLEKRRMEEKKIIQTLLRLLMNVFGECTKLAGDDFYGLVQRCIVYPEQVRPGKYLDLNMSAEMKQKIKEFRKQKAPLIIDDVTKFLKGRVVNPFGEERTMHKYFQKCVEFSWLAVVQDPPLVLDGEPSSNFDKDLFKEYTKRGPYVEFVVWPALRLHENGPLLSKGVLQGSDSFTFFATVTPAAACQTPPRPLPKPRERTSPKRRARRATKPTA